MRITSNANIYFFPEAALALPHSCLTDFAPAVVVGPVCSSLSLVAFLLPWGVVLVLDVLVLDVLSTVFVVDVVSTVVLVLDVLSTVVVVLDVFSVGLSVVMTLLLSISAHASDHSACRFDVKAAIEDSSTDRS